MKIAELIDHTLLGAGTSAADIKRVCEEAVSNSFAAVCIPPFFVTDARAALEGSKVKLATVIGFPQGYAATVAKIEEIKRGIQQGVDEFDVVINIAAVKSGNWNFVRNDLDGMITACHLRAKVIKVIIETGLLTPTELRQICAICNDLKPNFVKTSTGFNGGGASPEIVAQLRSLLDKQIKIKASGGIRNAKQARQLIKAGADRLGASQGLSFGQEEV